MVSTVFYKDLYIISRSTVAGEKEKQGPLGKFFDYYIYIKWLVKILMKRVNLK